MALVDGDKLHHIKDPRFIHEYADQVLGIGFASANEPKVSLTFGRDLMDVEYETFREVHPGVFQTVAEGDGLSPKRIDFATFTMSLDAASRLRDLLTQMIEKAQIPYPGL
ncbi:hypothetical protein N7325_13450 [Stutzerimonas stutzeri]|uniref:hypothetical protein n=1 Tax=Stutzerimonas stutzeri TaxID=316 RepID=UPI00244AA5E4|nr:hypothetical protein [Stutzerimonas stutzeri]MDH0120818.1 hypothetical protein [Stutzerimonas stutzeri]